jgi:hypothetical protein
MAARIPESSEMLMRVGVLLAAIWGTKIRKAPFAKSSFAKSRIVSMLDGSMTRSLFSK